MTEEQKAELHKMLDDSLNLAEGIKSPVKVEALVRKQAGQEILVAPCPKCQLVTALSGPGKHLCRRCHTWLEYVRSE